MKPAREVFKDFSWLALINSIYAVVSLARGQREEWAFFIISKRGNFPGDSSRSFVESNYKKKKKEKTDESLDKLRIYHRLFERFFYTSFNRGVNREA